MSGFRTQVVCCLAGILLSASTAFGQSGQNRYLAYATYTEADPSQGYQGWPLAANGAGEVCAFNGRALLVIKPDATLGYFKPIGSIPAIVHTGNILAIAVDSAGNCYVSGIGTIVPTPGAYQSKKSSGMYVVKLDAQGDALLATYLGGSGNDIPGSIALDPSGNIWVAGSTTSNDLPVTSNAIQSSFQGGTNDAFITELNSAGTMLLYGTYLGGNGTDGDPSIIGTAGVTLAIDGEGDAVVTGATTSTNFPLFNPLETTGFSYVTKVSNSGQLVYSTLYGLSSGAHAVGVAADSTGNAYITGMTGYFGGLPLVNPIPDQSPGSFMAKLNVDGSALVYSTYLLELNSTPTAIVVDAQESATVGGLGGSQLLNPIEIYPDAMSLTTVDTTGDLVFSSNLGTSEIEGDIASLGVDSNGSVYMGTQAGIPFAPPLLQPIYGTERPLLGGREGYIGKVAIGTAASFSMPTSADFGNSDVGSHSGPAGVYIFNTGTTVITINDVMTTGDFSVAVNQCPGTFSQGDNCGIFVQFTPTAGGARNGTLVIDDNSPGNPHVVQLTGIGLAPGISLNPTTLNFPSQGLNTTSPSQKVTLKNTGGENLNISQIAISGANAGDFAELNTCGIILGAGSSCAISVTFTPTALGTRSATLTITDAVGNQTVDLTGTGAVSLGLHVPAGSSNSATVTAGVTAKYTLSIGGGGLSGTATLTCTGAPTGATCTLPSSENVSATTASNFTVSVSTTAPSSAALRHSNSSFTWFWAAALIGVVWLPVGQRSRRLAWKTVAMLSLLLVTFLVSCGGEGGSGGSGASGGTPAGTYTLTVTATMGSTNQSQTLKLTVN